MAETATKLPIRSDTKATVSAPPAWHPFGALRGEIDRLFDDFGRGSFLSPFRSSLFPAEIFGRENSWGDAPAVDIAEKDNAYEVTAELPGMDEKHVEVTLINNSLTIKGEKREEKEEKNKDYYLRERQFGSFERRFAVPEGVDINKIEANFNKGILTVTLTKKADALKPAKKIEIKSA